MNDLFKGVVHSAFQVSFGILIGGIADAPLPPPPPKNVPLTSELKLRMFAEVVAQLTVNGLIAAALIKMTEKLSENDMGDPTGGNAFIVALHTAQPKMLAKIERLGHVISGYVSQTEQAVENAVQHSIVKPSQAHANSVAIKQR